MTMRSPTAVLGPNVQLLRPEEERLHCSRCPLLADFKNEGEGCCYRHIPAEDMLKLAQQNPSWRHVFGV